MKKIIVIMLCLVLLAGCSNGADTAVTEESTEAAAETTSASTEAATEETTEPETEILSGINYKGLHAVFTPEEMAETEGRQQDFVVEQADLTLYIYQNVTWNDLTFTQVQYSFREDLSKISCTYTAEEGLDEMLEDWKSAMEQLYGAAGGSESMYIWHDGTPNYLTLAQLNETTIQLCFYFPAA